MFLLYVSKPFLNPLDNGTILLSINFQVFTAVQPHVFSPRSVTTTRPLMCHINLRTLGAPIFVLSSSFLYNFVPTCVLHLSKDPTSLLHIKRQATLFCKRIGANKLLHRRLEFHFVTNQLKTQPLKTRPPIVCTSVITAQRSKNRFNYHRHTLPTKIVDYRPSDRRHYSSSNSVVHATGSSCICPIS